MENGCSAREKHESLTTLTRVFGCQSTTTVSFPSSDNDRNVAALIEQAPIKFEYEMLNPIKALRLSHFSSGEEPLQLGTLGAASVRKFTVVDGVVT